MASNCSNCYGGCTEIVSDQCVKYTGVDVPVLGILKGDSLSYVEQALITFLTATINGTGIAIEIDEDLYCELVSQYLQECETVTALDLFKALVQAACNLQTQIDTINTTLTTLNADYDADCLSGVTDSSNTHAVLQAVITKLCEIDVDLAALALDVDTNYVKLSELSSLIAAYIASTATADRYYTRMVPYSILAYNGPLSNFDATGAGLPGTLWENIYLCNGLNGTIDIRGRVIAGTIVGVPGGALSATVNPASSPFNPNYALGDDANGVNSIILTTPQIPVHNHTLTDPEHFHFVAKTATITDTPVPTASTYVASIGNSPADEDYILLASASEADVGKTSSSPTGITIADTGGGEAHSNIQPTIATYWITYIPI